MIATGHALVDHWLATDHYDLLTDRLREIGERVKTQELSSEDKDIANAALGNPYLAPYTKILLGFQEMAHAE